MATKDDKPATGGDQAPKRRTASAKIRADAGSEVANVTTKGDAETDIESKGLSSVRGITTESATPEEPESKKLSAAWIAAIVAVIVAVIGGAATIWAAYLND